MVYNISLKQYVFIVVIVLASCEFSKVSLSSLEDDYINNKPFFQNLINLSNDISNYDSLNHIYNNNEVYKKIEKEFGLNIYSIDFYDDLLGKKIYISNGFRDCSGYMYFSDTTELNMIMSSTETLLNVKDKFGIKLIKLSDYIIGYNKNQEEPLDILYYNNLDSLIK